MFSVHTTPEKFENTTITGHFGIVFEEYSTNELTNDYRDVIVFEKFRFLKGFSSTPQSRRLQIPPVYLIYLKIHVSTFIKYACTGMKKKGTFTSFPQALDSLDWNAAKCVYRLFYRTTNASWLNITTNDCASTSQFVLRLEPNTLYEVAIRTENSEGPGPTSPSIFALSGQRPPPEPPTELIILRVNSSSFEVEWTPFDVAPPRTVDGYWV